MARSRCLLRCHHLDEFASFCEGLGWVRHEIKGDYEVLRMRRSDEKEPLLVYGRHGTTAGSTLQHYTTHGQALRMAQAYYRHRKSGK